MNQGQEPNTIHLKSPITRLRRPLLGRTVTLGITLLAGVMVIAPPQVAIAASAYCLNSPTDGDWNTAANWSAGSPPNGAGQVASFGTSSTTSISYSVNTELGGITFSAGPKSDTRPGGVIGFLGNSTAGTAKTAPYEACPRLYGHPVRGHVTSPS